MPVDSYKTKFVMFRVERFFFTVKPAWIQPNPNLCFQTPSESNEFETESISSPLCTYAGTNYKIFLHEHFIYIFTDLYDQSFTVGRDQKCQWTITAQDVPPKFWDRISKMHCQITKDLSDLANPVYIEVSRTWLFVCQSNQLTALRPITGLISKRNISQRRIDWNQS